MSAIKYIYIGRRPTKSKIADLLPEKKNAVFKDDYQKTTNDFLAKFNNQPNVHTSDSNVHGSWFYFFDSNLILYVGIFK